MSTESSAAVNAAASAGADRAIGAAELITRMAEEMRVKSGSDLPLSCFVEQVKMQLAGRSPADVARTAPDRVVKRSNSHAHQTSELFKAWAMPD